MLLTDGTIIKIPLLMSHRNVRKKASTRDEMCFMCNVNSSKMYSAGISPRGSPEGVKSRGNDEDTSYQKAKHLGLLHTIK